MATQLIRQEIYDDTGLIDVIMIEQEVTNTEELIAEKEQELIRIYNEIQELKQK